MPHFDDINLRRRIRGVTRAALPPAARQVNGVSVRGSDGNIRTPQPKDFPRAETIAPRDVGLRQPAQGSPRFSQTERPLVRTQASTAENADIAGRLARFRNTANREELARGSLPGGEALGLTRPQGDPLSMRRAELEQEIDQVDLSGDQSIPSLVANAARRRRLLGEVGRVDERQDQLLEFGQERAADERDFQQDIALEGFKASLQRPQAASPLGKLIQDQGLIERNFGEDSPQARAIQEAVQAEQMEQGGASLSDVASMRKEFTQTSSSFLKAQDGIRLVEAGARDPSPAGDFAMIFNFMKVLDPDSVVRESEFRAAAEAGELPSRVQNAYDIIIGGHKLSPAQRQDFVERARRLYQAQLATHRQREKEFARIARQNNIDPSNVIVDFVSVGDSDNELEFDPDSGDFR